MQNTNTQQSVDYLLPRSAIQNLLDYPEPAYIAASPQAHSRVR